MYIIFHQDKLCFGIPVNQVREVLTPPQISHLPNALSFIVGTCDLRGHSVVIMDLGLRMNMSSVKSQNNRHVLVVRSEKIVLGLLVDRVIDVVDLENAITDKADDFAGDYVDCDFIKGVAHSESKNILLLDMDKILNVEEKDKLLSIGRTNA